MDIHTSIGMLKGIGPKTEKLFQKLGVFTIGDILLHYPREYQKLPPIAAITELTEDKTNAFLGEIKTVPFVKSTSRMQVTTTQITRDKITVRFTWFRMPYLKNSLKPGMSFVFLGKVKKNGSDYSMEQPQIYTVEKYESMQRSLWPCYALTDGLKKNIVSKTVKQVLDELDLTVDYLPERIRTKNQLAEYNFAVTNIHFPKDEQSWSEARKRLVFDEFFQFIVSMKIQKQQMEEVENTFCFADENETPVKEIIEKLPFSLTNAQLKTIQEIRDDLRGKKIMQRLVQGDVGSGKTIIAFLAMADVSYSGYQSALMAPTEVLAMQHYQTFTELCEQYELKTPVILLTGSMTAKEKRRAYSRMQVYQNAMVIGTHALIQEKALFDNLALVITDEQHRFGVKQRESLFFKGSQPHVLVMSATPIPRTLAIILYGDLDISVIDEVPAKRLPIKNCVVDIKYREKAYQFIKEEVEKGRQTYIICALVEESEGIEAENVLEYTQTVQEKLGKDIQVGYLYGKMKPKQKNQIMDQFLHNEIQVLVSTTVVEVGVNVPNATVMMIEDAQRFGLAQLHQLRGRVGRGEHQSYCIMVQTNDSEKAKKRLEVLNKSNDGFFIAAEDLKLRGPGDFFGIRQSGLLEFKLGDIYQDSIILKAAQTEAKELLEKDFMLSDSENNTIKEQIEQYMQMQAEIANL